MTCMHPPPHMTCIVYTENKPSSYDMHASSSSYDMHSLHWKQALLLNKTSSPPPGGSTAIENSCAVLFDATFSFTFFPTHSPPPTLEQPGAVIIDGIRFLALLTKKKNLSAVSVHLMSRERKPRSHELVHELSKVSKKVKKLNETAESTNSPTNCQKWVFYFFL